MKKVILAVGVLGVEAGTASAHPGEHGFSTAASLYHLLTEPDHLAMLAVAAVIAVALAYGIKRRSV